MREQVLSSVLLSHTFHASFSMRVHITLKTATSQRDSETDCISLVGMFVLVTLRPTDQQRKKKRERVSRDHLLCGTEGLAEFDLEEASDR